MLAWIGGDQEQRKATMAAEYVPLSELNVDEVINLLEKWGLSKDMGKE